MSIQPPLLPIEVSYPTGSTLYAVIHNRASPSLGNADTYWNTVTQQFESFNSGNWTKYAVPLAEVVPTGYYRAAFPTAAVAAAGGSLFTEAIYVQAGGQPSVSDAIASALQHSQGENLAGILADYQSLYNMLLALNTEQPLIVSSVPNSTQVIATTAPSGAVDCYAGRVLIIASGGSAQQALRITAYDPNTATFTVATPFISAPGPGDMLIIV